MEKLYCPRCDKDVEMDIVQKKENYNVMGEQIGVHSNVAVCTRCEEEIFSEELDEKNIEKAYSKYRKKYNLLTPQEIKGIREMYGLSQRSLGALLKWGEITIHRYETGGIQDQVHNDLLVLISKPDNIQEIYERNRDYLPTYAQTRLKERIKELLKGQMETNLNRAVENMLAKKMHNKEYTGNILFNLEKIKNLILLICSHHNVYKTKLNKLLWYIDFLYFKKYSVSITGNSYTHFPYGPTFDGYELILGIMIEEQLISKEEVVFSSEVTGESLRAKVCFDKSMFNDNEFDVINYVLSKFKNFNCKKISEFSHKEIPYKRTANGKQISYRFANELSLRLP